MHGHKHRMVGPVSLSQLQNMVAALQIGKQLHDAKKIQVVLTYLVDCTFTEMDGTRSLKL